MFNLKLPRWLSAILGVLVVIALVVVPAIRAAADPGDDSSPTPAATSATPKASEEPKADESPSPTPKETEKADPAPSETPKATEKADPAKTTKAPAPKPSEPSEKAEPSSTATQAANDKSAKPSASAPAAKKAVSTSQATTVIWIDPPAQPPYTECVDGVLTVTRNIDGLHDQHWTWYHYDAEDDDFSIWGANPDKGYAFNGVTPEGGTFKWKDGKYPCGSSKIKVTAVNGTFTDECGPDFNLKFVAAETEGVKYNPVTKGNTITVTAEVTDPGKYELTNPEWSQTAKDELVACPVVTPTAKLVLRCDKIDGEKTGWVEAKLTLDNSQFESGSNFLVNTSWPGDKVDSELFVAAESTETFYGYFPAGGVLRNVVTWEGKVILDQSDDTQKCMLKDEPTPKPTPAPSEEPTQPTWQQAPDHRGVPKDTGPGEEPLVAVSPLLSQGVVGAFVFGCFVLGGVVVLRRRGV